MAAFPGDPEFVSEPIHSLSRGDAYSASRLTFGSHAGTHVDPPRHFLPDREAVDHIDLGILNGPCLVVGVDRTRLEVGGSDLPPFPSDTRRVLFRTANSERWARDGGYFPDFVALTLSAAEELLRRGIRLVGIDALSVESDPQLRFPVHHLLLRGGALILEGLLLAEVPPGPYELECLPLRLHEGDGGPARAVLLTP